MEKISPLSILAIPFSVIVSVCYLMGYWGTFNIDIFSYLTASDIIVLSAIPWIGMGISSLVGLGIGRAIHRFEEATKESPDKKIIAARKGIKITDKIIMVFIFLTLVFGGPEKWLILPMLFSLLVTWLLFISGLIELNKGSLRNQLILTLLVTLLPFQAFGYGKNKALHIEQGSRYKYVVNKIKGVKVPEKTDLRYLGKAGKVLFFYNASNKQIIIIERTVANPLILASSANILKNESTNKQPNK